MRIVDPASGKSHFEKRRRRYNEAGQPRELTFSCYRRLPFFSRERTCEWSRQALEEARAKFGFQVWAYVLMPDHVHLLVNPGDAAAEMSRFLQAVKEPVARQAIAYLKVNAPQCCRGFATVAAKAHRARGPARAASFLATWRGLRSKHHEH